MKKFNSYNLVTAPVSQPVSLAEAKAHCYIEIDDDDSIVNAFIIAATKHVENIIRKKIITQTWLITDSNFCDYEIELPFGKLQAITIKYYDEDGVLQTLTDGVDFISDKDSQTGKVKPKSGNSWPSVADTDLVFNPVQFEITVGYGDETETPELIKHAILLIIGHLYENREQTTTLNLKQLPLGVDALLSSFVLYGW